MEVNSEENEPRAFSFQTCEEKEEEAPSLCAHPTTNQSLVIGVLEGRNAERCMYPGTKRPSESDLVRERTGRNLRHASGMGARTNNHTPDKTSNDGCIDVKVGNRRCRWETRSEKEPSRQRETNKRESHAYSMAVVALVCFDRDRINSITRHLDIR